MTSPLVLAAWLALPYGAALVACLLEGPQEARKGASGGLADTQ